MRRGELLKSIDDTIERGRMVAPLFGILFHILSRERIFYFVKKKIKKHFKIYHLYTYKRGILFYPVIKISFNSNVKYVVRIKI